MMTGGLSDTKPATPDVQHIVNQYANLLIRGTQKQQKTSLGVYPPLKITGPETMLDQVVVKPQFESRVNRTYGIFQAIVYRTQVVAGINYFIKVQVSDTEYVHLRVFQSLPHENQGPSLVNFETGKTRDDPLTYF